MPLSFHSLIILNLCFYIYSLLSKKSEANGRLCLGVFGSLTESVRERLARSR